MTKPEKSPKITKLLFTAPRNETQAKAVILKFHLFLSGSDIFSKEMADQNIIKAKIGWYWG